MPAFVPNVLISEGMPLIVTSAAVLFKFYFRPHQQNQTVPDINYKYSGYKCKKHVVS